MNTFIPTGPLEERLRSLRQLAPDLSEALHSLGEMLALSFSSSDAPIAPYDFYRVIEITLEDSYRHEPSTYFALTEAIPSLARAVCPPDFADKVEQCHRLAYLPSRKQLQRKVL